MALFLAATLAYNCHQGGDEESSHHPPWKRELFQRKNELSQRCSTYHRQLQRAFKMTTSSSPSSSSSSSGSSMETAVVASPVRQEWIDAVFGNDFYASEGYVPPRQGVGLAEIPHFISYQVEIPAGVEKVGVTLSRLSLGLYVESASHQALAAGVLGHSILVSINGVAMLGEPSRNALERLEQYQSTPTEDAKPVVLVLFRNGSMYTVVLLSAMALKDITWAACGDFALVQRTSGMAAEAGVKRGSLVASVNDTQSLRDLDHVGAATCLKQALGDQPIRLCLCYTPKASRSSRPAEAAKKTVQDGVELRVHPYASLFQARPERQRRQQRVYEPLPHDSNWLQQWNVMEAMLYCLRYHAAHYDEDLLYQTPQQSLLEWVRSDLELVHTYLLQLLVLLHTNDSIADTLGDILLQHAQQDVEFLQTLRFLLRSFESTELLEKLALHPVETITTTPPPEVVETSSSSPEVCDVIMEDPKQRKRSFPRLFRKRKSSKHTAKLVQLPEQPTPVVPMPTAPVPKVLVDPATLDTNMMEFLELLRTICDEIERSLSKSVRQKLAEWAPWSASQKTALNGATEALRKALVFEKPLASPVDSTEILTALDPTECYILPSSHFPLLLSFDVSRSNERLYRTNVEVVALRGGGDEALTHFVHGAVAGTVLESGRSVQQGSMEQVWETKRLLTFTTASTWGAPQTLSLRLSSAVKTEDGQDCVSPDDSSDGRLNSSQEVGFCWVDLKPLWNKRVSSASYHCQVLSLDGTAFFDQNGELPDGPPPVSEQLELELRVTTEVVGSDDSGATPLQKRMLLHKHDGDLRQELFSIQFIQTCDRMLRASGLDLKLLTFRCVPVGARQGFIEWVQGSVPLSEICRPFAGSILAEDVEDLEENSLSEVAKAGLKKHQSLHRPATDQSVERGSFANNPIQDYLRSVAYDAGAPYLIQREVMDNYVKSCAGYCVISYLLGVGDRHLDNLLLHQKGYFFHCDFSFILGNDPKKYLPMRITPDMVYGMGGDDSDNYAKFLSLAGATFVVLRRPENVRLLMSLVRMMEASLWQDTAEQHTLEHALLGLRERLRLDLSDDMAISFLEDLIEKSTTSKMWIAVDAIHSLGKRF